ncbi:MAG: hypothetical protein WDZ88_01760 [Candidatus Paceibacterota bacterium]
MKKFIFAVVVSFSLLVSATAETNKVSAVDVELKEVQTQIELVKARAELEKVRLKAEIELAKAQKELEKLRGTETNTKVSAVEAEVVSIKEQVALEKARAELAKAQAQNRPAVSQTSRYPGLEESREYYGTAASEAKARAEYWRNEEKAQKYQGKAIKESIEGFFADGKRYVLPAVKNTPLRGQFKSARVQTVTRGSGLEVRNTRNGIQVRID